MRRERTNEPGIYRVVGDDGRWISTQVAYRDQTRKLRWRTFSGPKTLTEAKRWKSANVDARATADRPDPTAGRVTLGDVFDAQLAGRAYAPKTIATRQEIRGRDGLRHLFAMPVGKVTRRNVDQAIAATTSAPSMAREIRKALSSAFGYAREAMGIELASNPAASSKLRRTRSEIVETNGEPARVLSREDLRRLIAELPERYRALVELIGRVGLRPGEAYALSVDAITADEVRIESSKTGKPRTIPIPADLADTLRRHVETYGANGLAFPSESGRAIDDHNWRRRVFQPAARRAGLDGLVPYDLRHTACSTALSLGVDPVTVANMSGHDVATLLRTYAHAVEAAKRRAADLLGRAWTA